MEQHKIDVVVERDGTITLEGVPFCAGDRVAVTIVATTEPDERRKSLRGTPVTVKEPYTPVAEADWDAMR